MNNIIWMPIDLPKFPIKNFSVETDVHWKFWDFSKLTESDNKNTYAVSSFKQSVDPALVEWFSLFPYKSIRNIKFNVQATDTVLPHIDFVSREKDPELFENNLHNEPCGYRILLRGSRTDSFYMKYKGQEIYSTMPDDTDVYVTRSTDIPHGVKDLPGRETIFTLFEIDEEKHRALIKRSYEKYKKYALLK